MEKVYIKTSNSRNCSTCNKAKVCKYNESATTYVEKIIKELEQKELPLFADIDCREWNGTNTGILRQGI